MQYICLRDDDTNFFTSIDELKAGYGKYWGNLPVTLAAIPFVHGSERKIMDYDLEKDKFDLLRKWQEGASSKELSEYHKVHPLGENDELVTELEHLIKAQKIEIAQHGVFHRYNERGGELYDDEMAYIAIRDGKEYLEKVFGTNIKTFIPPSNTIDIGCLRYVKNLNMHLFCSGAVKCKSYGDKILSYIIDPLSIIERVGDRALKRKVPIYRRLGIYMFGSITYNIFNKESDIMEKMLTSLEKTGFASLGTHYRLLADTKYKEHYHHILQELSNRKNIEFVTADQYYCLMMEKFHG